MAIPQDSTVGTTPISEPIGVSSEAAPWDAARSSSMTSTPGRSVYLNAATACLPRWIRLVGSAPWLGNAAASGRFAHHGASRLGRQHVAAVAIGLLTELDTEREDLAFLRERVRSSLISWQMSLRNDGYPARRPTGGGRLSGVTSSLIIQFLNETADLQTGSLLRDVERHSRWLIRCLPRTPWVEAATICALADGAVLVRDASLLTCARERLQTLLGKQDEEGWFPERGGADIGRLSLTLDALAHVHRRNGWDELAEPLQRLTRFLLHFVHPDGTAGGCYSSCGTAFLSPYGIELMATSIPEAAQLARVCRTRYEKLATERFASWHDDLCAILGSKLVLAAGAAPRSLARDSRYPYEEEGARHFPNAGLSIFVTDAYHAVVGGRNGGALRVTWSSEAPPVYEPGITVLSAHGARTSARCDVRTDVRTTHSSVTCNGVPRNVRPRKHSWLRTVARRVRETVSRHAKTTAAGNRRRFRSLAHNPLARDRYRRTITFSSDTIRIQDWVRCRLPCRTILLRSCQDSLAEKFVDRSESDGARPETIFIDGGRNIEISRVYHRGALEDQRIDENPPAVPVPGRRTTATGELNPDC